MQRIDAHQHFWVYDPVRDSWINERMSRIQRDFLPGDLAVVLKQTGFDGCVAVQADQSEDETEFLVSLAKNNAFIKGVVGWVNLQSEDIEERCEHFRRFSKIKGFRHILQGEEKRDLMLGDRFRRGIRALGRHGFTYDILIYPDQLQYAAQLVREFPGQRFVIDHMAKPFIRLRKIDEWKKDMQDIARYENVYCKLSGFVTEADWHAWKKADFFPYFDAVTKAFGTKRLMFGSDWPVCLVAAEYEMLVQIVEEYFSSSSKEELQDIFGGNAITFYNL